MMSMVETLSAGFANFLNKQQAEMVQSWQALGGVGDVFKAYDESLAYGSSQVRLIEGGDVFERAGIALSLVDGDKLPSQATARHPQWQDLPFKVMGLSAVVHPRNPYVPTVHANIRLFIVQGPEDGQMHWWVGGGVDATPYCTTMEACALWHHQLAAFYQQHGMGAFYQAHKQACDQYFYLPHRREPRGIGGVFFDDFQGASMAQTLTWLQALMQHFTHHYGVWVAAQKAHPYDQIARQYQCFRRSRYVEFNLLHDRGTKFGLAFGGRTEAIMMSMPPEVHWHFAVPNACCEAEHALQAILRPRDWVDG
jgi:coproporphyrinogen III oxidase